MSTLCLFLALLLIYLVPTFVARARNHHNYGAIVALNILTGWSFVGWVAALVWALTATRTASTA